MILNEFYKLMLRVTKARVYFDEHKDIKPEILNKMYDLVNQIDVLYAKLSEEEKKEALKYVIAAFN